MVYDLQIITSWKAKAHILAVFAINNYFTFNVQRYGKLLNCSKKMFVFCFQMLFLIHYDGFMYQVFIIRYYQACIDDI